MDAATAAGRRSRSNDLDGRSNIEPGKAAPVTREKDKARENFQQFALAQSLLASEGVLVEQFVDIGQPRPDANERNRLRAVPADESCKEPRTTSLRNRTKVEPDSDARRQDSRAFRLISASQQVRAAFQDGELSCAVQKELAALHLAAASHSRTGYVARLEDLMDSVEAWVSQSEPRREDALAALRRAGIAASTVQGNYKEAAAELEAIHQQVKPHLGHVDPEVAANMEVAVKDGSTQAYAMLLFDSVDSM